VAYSHRPGGECAHRNTLQVLPLCVVGILDSYRAVYWSRTEMVEPTLAITLLMGRIYRVAATAKAAREKACPDESSLTSRRRRSNG
jgi:hypothetical protein